MDSDEDEVSYKHLDDEEREAEENGEELREEDEDDDEEEEEGQDEYEKDGWMVDEDEEEEEVEEKGNQEERIKKKKKKRKERELELDEEDYELLQENVTGFHRPTLKGGQKKFKRLKKAGKVLEEDAPSELRDDEDAEEEGAEGGGRNAEEQLKRSLFGDLDEGVPEDVPEEQDEEEEEEGEEDDEMADFIVDGPEEIDENGEPVRRARKKKKKGRRPMAGGATAMAMQEAQDIFGDVNEIFAFRQELEAAAAARGRLEEEAAAGLGADDADDREAQQRRAHSRALQKQYEPSVLESRYMTDRDEVIRSVDVPERMQLLEEEGGVAADVAGNAAAEAAWIYEHAFGQWATGPRHSILQHVDRQTVIEQTEAVLKRMHEDKEEVPFIGLHRKQYCPGLVEHYNDNDRERPRLQKFEVLWIIQWWDRRWLALQRRKEVLRSAYRQPRLDPADEATRQSMVARVLDLLDDAASEAAVEDVDAKFNLQFPMEDGAEHLLQNGGGGRGGGGARGAGAPGQGGAQYRRPKKKSLYRDCKGAGLADMAEKFGMSSYKFSENLKAMYKQYEVDDCPQTPEEVALNFVRAEFKDTQLVLKGARHLAEVEMSVEPGVREHVRALFRDKAVVSVRPTKAGDAIDSFHRYAGVKWLKDKPVWEFRDEQWLLISKGEDEGLLQVTLGLPPAFVDKSLLQEFEAAYLSDGVSRSAQLWNEQRRLILRGALLSRLLPAMEQETRRTLAGRSRQYAADQCGAAMWRQVSVAPYDLRSNKAAAEDQSDAGPWLRVMACCWGPGNPATTFVMLDAGGELVDLLHAGHISIRGGGAEQQERKKRDEERLMQFMMEHRPHVAVLGAANLGCRRLREEIFEVICTITEKHPRNLPREVDSVNVVYEDETLAQVYENSPVSQEQLPGQPGIIKRAVALGRFMQNRLAMVASLCGAGREILSAKLHPLQDLISPDEAYAAIERVMVTVTNQVGVDVNLAAAHDWLFAPLQFVCGLGPRKAAHLARKIRGEGALKRRRELVEEQWMKVRVFVNAAAAVRVRGGAAEDPLDDTRIHPESYELAQRMALDAYCEDQQVTPEDVEARDLDTVAEVRESPGLIRGLDIDAYCREAEDRGQRREDYDALVHVKRELMCGFREWRDPYEPLTQDEEFALLSGESDETLAEGRVLQATVRKLVGGRVLCTLESGLQGVIEKRDLSDDKVADIAARVAEGTVLTCRVKEVKKTMYEVALTSKGSDLRSDRWKDLRQWDRYYVHDPSSLLTPAEKAMKKKEEVKRLAYKPRMITHPKFKNVSLQEAIQILSDPTVDIGDFVIRPSSKGPSNLSLTLKFYEGLYTHVDIREEGKDNKDMTSFLRLGKVLDINGEKYEDLDEVVARYVEPIAKYLGEMTQYRKFRNGSKQEVDAALVQEKLANPARIPYYFSPSAAHPGAFVLSYIRSSSPIHEYLTVTPDGYRYRKGTFRSPDKLVKYFQAHFSEPLPEAPPQQRRAVAAMVGPPRESGGGGGQGGGYHHQGHGHGHADGGGGGGGGGYGHPHHQQHQQHHHAGGGHMPAASAWDHRQLPPPPPVPAGWGPVGAAGAGGGWGHVGAGGGGWGQQGGGEPDPSLGGQGYPAPSMGWGQGSWSQQVDQGGAWRGADQGRGGGAVQGNRVSSYR